MSLLLEQLAKNGSVTLEGYGHQVGGHHLLMKFEDTICKPLTSREHFFYETVTPQLRLFTPSYYGVITVSFIRKPSGEIQLVALPKTNPEISPLMLERIDFDSVAQNVTVAAGEGYVNPWSAECTKVTREKLQNFGDQLETIHQDYLVLENLTSKFHSPSILDIKVGTRQYGDDVPEWKKAKHIQTCANSTSRTLGARFCGMQKYDASKHEYIFRDKYYGRALSSDEFKEELRTFLHNGIHFRADIIPRLIEMIKQLKDVISSQDTYRFFSSSLLIIYDGKGKPGDQPTPPSAAATPTTVNGCVGGVAATDVECKGHLPNMPNWLKPGVTGPFKPDDANHVDLMHIDREALYRKFKDVLPSSPKTDKVEKSMPERNSEVKTVPPTKLKDGTSTVVDSSSEERDSSVRENFDQSSLSSSLSLSPHPNGLTHPHHHGNQPTHEYAYDLSSSRSLVDLRMIDFAHATHQGYEDPIRYQGEDDGYIFGLNTLIEIFQSML